MLGMKNKDLIVLGFILGIALFFIGEIIVNIFPSSETNLIGYKISAFNKMMGIGIFTCSLVVGGLIIEENYDKKMRILLFVFGLIILLIYTVGAEQLHWDITEYSGSNLSPSEAAYEERPSGYGIPGFEAFYMLISSMKLIKQMLFKERGCKEKLSHYIDIRY